MDDKSNNQQQEQVDRSGGTRSMSDEDNNAAPHADPIVDSASDATSEPPTQRDSGNNEEERDELKEVRKESRQDTIRVRIWRLVVTGTMLGTGLGVTLATYFILKNQQQSKFETAFDHFATTVTSAAVNRNHNLRLAYSALADMISTEAYLSNATWPFYTFPRYEQFAINARFESKTELNSILHLVNESDRKAWLQYASQNYVGWVREGYEIAKIRESVFRDYDKTFNATGYHPYISQKVNNTIVPQSVHDSYYVSWSFSPPPFTYGFINFDFLIVPDYAAIIKAVSILKNETLVTEVRKYVSAGIAYTPAEHAAMHSPQLASVVDEIPHSIVFHPVRRVPDDFNSEVVAVIAPGSAWDAFMIDLLPTGVRGIVVVIHNNCNQSYTFELDGTDAYFLGSGDLHDSKYNDMEMAVRLDEHTHPQYETVPGHCIYSLSVYPSATFEKSWDDNTAQIFVIVISITFVFVVAVFYIYDMYVQRRNDRLVERAAKSGAIVSALFPENVRDKVMEGAVAGKDDKLKALMNGGETLDSFEYYTTKPVADLFVETTILFADIVGFTAWSSVREPSQVFILLESLYGSFDKIAKARRVFKVETVGDCYVAATGLPEPRKDHVAVMCRFARDIMTKMGTLVRELETVLGPETAELSLRIGIHSGPVTAGVLRGEKARFQLFGDTMNTTARIETTGLPGRIHLSQETADILVGSGKAHWVEKRDGMVVAKGKGEIQTYWLVHRFSKNSSSSVRSGEETASSTSEAVDEQVNDDLERSQRLICWQVEVFLQHLKLIVARRNMKSLSGKPDTLSLSELEKRSTERTANFLEEATDIIRFPLIESGSVVQKQDVENIVIDEEVVAQLRDYLMCISNAYGDNHFHNFEHASHVTMSVSKLFSRIIGGSVLPATNDRNDHTYGIAFDPLTAFTCAFAAMIHDVGHTGAPNTQLIKEKSPLAAVYSMSIAEQNSLALAWDLLMDNRFTKLRSTIYRDESELRLFRQLLVNAVMATDLLDPELNTLRNARWETAFGPGSAVAVEENSQDAVNRKATIVIEYLMQAADVAHTVQHWHIYRRWNERLFFECHKAFRDGRADTDPSKSWYEGELNFFDLYVIPLAKKLKDSGVFGKSSDEFLNYALQNRKEWEARGNIVVAGMVKILKERNEWDDEDE